MQYGIGQQRGLLIALSLESDGTAQGFIDCITSGLRKHGGAHNKSPQTIASTSGFGHSVAFSNPSENSATVLDHVDFLRKAYEVALELKTETMTKAEELLSAMLADERFTVVTEHFADHTFSRYPNGRYVV